MVDTQDLKRLLSAKSHNEKDSSAFLRKKAYDLISSPSESVTSQPIKVLITPLSGSDIRTTSLQRSSSAGSKNSSRYDLLLVLLQQVIRPLFTASQHKNLTSTGRLKTVDDSLPAAANRFSASSLFDDKQRPGWKAEWVGQLLVWIIQQLGQDGDKNDGHLVSTSPDRHGSPNTVSNGDMTANSKDSRDLRRKAVEECFHLLVPPTLIHLDDHELDYKVRGLTLLKQLCDLLVNVRSDILKRSGLMDVFVNTMKHDFSRLPTLETEADSLRLFGALYPAYQALVEARFVQTEVFPKTNVNGRNTVQGGSDKKNGAIKVIEMEGEERITTRSDTKSTSIATAAARLPSKLQHRPQDSVSDPHLPPSEQNLRTKYLTTLLRHQLQHSLSHLSSPSPSSSNPQIPILTFSHPTLATFLLTQLPWLIDALDIEFTAHLKVWIPLLLGTMMDPFASTKTELLIAAIRGLKVVVQVCWMRIRVTDTDGKEGGRGRGRCWWMEILRGVVGCYLNVFDDILETRRVGSKRRGHREEGGLEEVLVELRILVALLEDVVGEEFTVVKREILAEEEDLEGLFRLDSLPISLCKNVNGVVERDKDDDEGSNGERNSVKKDSTKSVFDTREGSRIIEVL